MLWAALLVGTVAFLVMRVRGSSTPNAFLSGVGLAVVLGAIAVAQEGWEPVPILILVGAIGGSLASTAVDRELHSERQPRPDNERPI